MTDRDQTPRAPTPDESPRAGAARNDGERTRNSRGLAVHGVWAITVLLALLIPVFGFKTFRQENREDLRTLADQVGGLFHQDVTRRFVSSVSEVGEGRLLELASLRTHETLTETLTRSWLGFAVDSEVRLEAPVVYRYGVRWDSGWRITLTGHETEFVCIVEAPELEPFQPPSIDTAGLRVSTRERLLGPDTEASRNALVRRFTPYARRRAATPEYRAIVRELARRTLVEYVEQWLVGAQLVTPEMPVRVYARFADDAPSDDADRTLEYQALNFR